METFVFQSNCTDKKWGLFVLFCVDMIVIIIASLKVVRSGSLRNNVLCFLNLMEIMTHYNLNCISLKRVFALSGAVSSFSSCLLSSKGIEKKTLLPCISVSLFKQSNWFLHVHTHLWQTHLDVQSHKHSSAGNDPADNLLPTPAVFKWTLTRTKMSVGLNMK